MGITKLLHRGALLAVFIASGCVTEDMQREVVVDRTIADDDDEPIEGFDCSQFSNYPPPPPWEGPGDHCAGQGNPRPPNPGCAPGTEDVCTIPPSGWPGPYNIYVDNCHDAASCGVDAGSDVCQETGILSCNEEITSGPTGHTVNYTVTPAGPPNEGKFVVCLSNPQSSDPDGSKCCWLQDDDTPDTGVGEPGRECYEHMCHRQTDDEGGTVLPVGECWPEDDDPYGCGDTWGPEALKCCQDHAKYWDNSLKKWCTKKGYDAQVGFRCDHYANCVASAGGTIPEPPQPPGETDTDSDTDTDTDGDSDGDECTCATSNGHEMYEAQGWTCDESTCAPANGGADCFCTWTLVNGGGVE